MWRRAWTKFWISSSTSVSSSVLSKACLLLGFAQLWMSASHSHSSVHASECFYRRPIGGGIGGRGGGTYPHFWTWGTLTFTLNKYFRAISLRLLPAVAAFTTVISPCRSAVQAAVCPMNLLDVSTAEQTTFPLGTGATSTERLEVSQRACRPACDIVQQY